MAFLKQIPLFRDVKEEDLQKVLNICVQQTFKKGHALFREGDPAHGFYIVVSGKVKIFKLSPDGKEYTMRIIRPGESFAQVPLFFGDSFPASASAISPVEVLYLEKDAFKSLVRERPQLAVNMLSNASLLLKGFTLKLEELALKDAPARVAQYLIAYAISSDLELETGLSLTLDTSKGLLASHLGITGETLSRTFSKLKNAGQSI
jgi:CRP/FNR family transcriptional regulator